MPPFLSQFASCLTCVVLRNLQSASARLTEAARRILAWRYLAQNFNQVVADNFDDLLTGREQSSCVPHGLACDLIYEMLDYFEVYVCLKQSEAQLRSAS
jgi:hypothetical protein